MDKKIDILSIKPIERKIELKHPGTDEPLGVFLTVVSTEDERLKKIERNFTNRGLALRSRGKIFSADEINANKLDYLVASIVDWDWTKSKIEWRGENPECTSKNVRDLLSGIPWVLNQVDEEVGNLKAFF
jgi:hypothetical protein